MSLPAAIAGAGAGFFVGGPPGAVVGALVGLLMGGKATGSRVSRAATASEVQAAVQANVDAAQGQVVSTEEGATTYVPKAILSPDNALGRLRAAIDKLASAATAAGAEPTAVAAWQQAASAAERQMAVSLMMSPGGFSAPSMPTPPAGTPAGATAAFNSVLADVVSALVQMDQAKAKGLAEYDWR